MALSWCAQACRRSSSRSRRTTASSGAALGFSRLLTNTTSSSMVTTPGVDFSVREPMGPGQYRHSLVGRPHFGGDGGADAHAVRQLDLCDGRQYRGGARRRRADVARQIVLFVTTALAATLVGAIQAVEFHSGNAANGQGYVFQAPIAAVIGGVLLGGGYGSPLGCSSVRSSMASSAWAFSTLAGTPTGCS